MNDDIFKLTTFSWDFIVNLGSFQKNCACMLIVFYSNRWNQKIPTDDQALFVDFIFEANATYQDKQLEFIKDVLALDNLPIVAGSSPKVKEVHDTFTARLIVLIGKYNLQMDVFKILNEVCMRYHMVLTEHRVWVHMWDMSICLTKC